MKIRKGYEGLVWKGCVYEKNGQKCLKRAKKHNIFAIITQTKQTKLLKLPGHFLTTLSCLPSGTVSENANEQI